MVGLSDSRPPSLLLLKCYCIIQSTLLDMIIPFKWITGFLSTGQTYSSRCFLQNTLIIKKVTMPAVTEQRLSEFFSIWSSHWHQLISCFWLTSIHCTLYNNSDVSWNHFSLFPVYMVQTVWPNFKLLGCTCNSDLINQHSPISFTIVIGSGMVWFKLVQWYSAIRVLLNCGGEAQKLSLLRLLGFVVWKL